MTPGRHSATGGRHSAPEVVPVRRAVRDGLAPRPDAAGAEGARHRGDTAPTSRRVAGGSRQRHDPTESGPVRQPELRIITGEGRIDGTRAADGGGRHRAGTPRRRGGHLRAVPGERSAG